MSPTPFLFTFAAASLLPVQPYAAFESPKTYEIAVRAAVASLPDELRPFFEALRATIVEAATNKLADAGGEAIHRLPLDGSAESTDPIERRAQVQKFLSLIAESKKDGILNRDDRWANTLPRRIATAYHSLEDSFKSRNRDDITRDAGAVMHFAVDAAMPFNVTHDKWCKSVQTADDDKQSPALPSRRFRYHVVLVERLADRLTYEARIAPQRLHPLKDLSQAVLDTLAGAHEAALSLEQVERNAGSELREGNRSAPGEKSAALEDLLAERAAPIIETQIESGALFGAELIVSAWIEAGKPALPGGVTGPASAFTAAPTRRTSEASSTEKAFVGSRSSKIFHRSSCNHVARIKPENRVQFGSAEQAKAQGRTPCKTCKPDQ